MKDYYVEVPVIVKLMVGVRAKSKEEAKEKLHNAEIVIDIKDDSDKTEWVDYEWEMHEKVVEGNVYYGGINEMYIKEED